MTYFAIGFFTSVNNFNFSVKLRGINSCYVGGAFVLPSERQARNLEPLALIASQVNVFNGFQRLVCAESQCLDAEEGKREQRQAGREFHIGVDGDL